MKTFKFILAFFLTLFLMLPNSQAQNYFPDKCLGAWEGTMIIYARGVVKDSVPVIFTVAKGTEAKTWVWKTEYFSSRIPVTKNYTLKLVDENSQVYITDEGNGIQLYDYLFDNKLYSVFETEGNLLTSVYELRGNDLLFEVTSGKKMASDEEQTVTGYSVSNVQRVVLKKMK